MPWAVDVVVSVLLPQFPNSASLNDLLMRFKGRNIVVNEELDIFYVLFGIGDEEHLLVYK